MTDIYAFDFLASLFDAMAASYDRVNYLTSFGFSQRFRRWLIASANIGPGHVVCDLMCGRGECAPMVAQRIGERGRLVGLDLSPGMLAGARRRRESLARYDVAFIEGNALTTGFDNDAFDRVILAFGLKTLAPDLRARLAHELLRIVRPGGIVAAIEMSEPHGWALRPVFMWYLKRVVPVLGALLLGNPEPYRMLGVYTERFQGCQPMVDAMRDAGFDAALVAYFHGCATGIVATKPLTAV